MQIFNLQDLISSDAVFSLENGLVKVEITTSNGNITNTKSVSATKEQVIADLQIIKGSVSTYRSDADAKISKIDDYLETVSNL